MKKKICRYCSSYHPSEKLKGCLGLCELKKKAKGFDESCEAFSEGAQTWMCGKPVKERRNSPTASV